MKDVCLAKPSAAQLAWQDMELAMFIHFGPSTWQGLEGDDLSTPLSAINPVELDTEQWVRAAKSFGAGLIVFVAKHVGGFAWWQTDTTTYGVKESPWRGGKGDVMKDLAASCRRHGLKLGVYLSPQDRFMKAAESGRCQDPAAQERYNAIYRQQLTEVLSRYGEIFEVWFDGNIVVNVSDILAKHAPNAIVFQGPHTNIRWVGTELGYTPYPAWNSESSEQARQGWGTACHGRPDGDAWVPLEVDTTLHLPTEWFWNPRSAGKIRSLDQLMDVYYKSVGRGALLLLNAAPDTTGRIPGCDEQRYAEFGAEICRRFGSCLAETSGQGEAVELDLKRPTRIDHVITREDIAQGERVHEYVIEGRFADGWRPIGEGVSIGHKKIDHLQPVEVLGVRLRVTRCAAVPLIRRLAVFNVGVAPKPLPGQGGTRVGEWDARTVDFGRGRADVDITRFCQAPGRYEVVFAESPNHDQVRCTSTKLLRDGVEVPDAIEGSLDLTNVFYVHVRAPSASSLLLQVNLELDCNGGLGKSPLGVVLMTKR